MKQYVQKNIRSKNSNKIHKFKTASVAVAAVAVLTSLLTGVIASAMQNTTAYKIANFLGIEKNLDSYETAVNQAVTIDNVTLELKDVIINHDELWVSVISKSSKYNSSQLVGPLGTVYINGEEINAGAMGEVKKLDENTVQSLIRFPLK